MVTRARLQAMRQLKELAHINRPHEIMSELRSRFSIVNQAYFPLRVPIVGLNLMIGLTLTGLTGVHV